MFKEHGPIVPPLSTHEHEIRRAAEPARMETWIALSKGTTNGRGPTRPPRGEANALSHAGSVQWPAAAAAAAAVVVVAAAHFTLLLIKLAHFAQFNFSALVNSQNENGRAAEPARNCNMAMRIGFSKGTVQLLRPCQLTK
jgi:hypothetical protein